MARLCGSHNETASSILVINHIDAPASIYENVQPDDDVITICSQARRGAPHRRGIGAKLILTRGTKAKYLLSFSYRGTCHKDDREPSGSGRAKRVDSLEVICARWASSGADGS